MPRDVRRFNCTSSPLYVEKSFESSVVMVETVAPYESLTVRLT